MGWRAKKYGPKITRAHRHLHFGLVRDGIRHLNNYYLMGRTRRWNVDVYIPPWLIIEVDGSSHRGKQLLKDKIKTADLEQAELPFTVIRFWDHDIKNELPKTLITIYTTLTWGPHTPNKPTPGPHREALYSLATTSMKKRDQTGRDNT